MADKFKQLKKAVLQRSSGKDDSENLADEDSVRRPESVPNLEDYEGTMVGMGISDSVGKPLGLPGAVTDRRDSEALAAGMLRMQSNFMDDVGIREGRGLEKLPSDDEEASKGSKVLGSKWTKISLALLGICGLFAISALVLHFRKAETEKAISGQKLMLQDLVDKSSGLKHALDAELYEGKCAKYEDVFLHWLTAFCRFINCTSELCHRYWTPYGGNCYYFSTEILNWEASRQNCISQGSELLVIRSKVEQKFVAKYDVQKVYWIGLTEAALESTWKWVDGTYLEDDLTFWGRDFPDSYFDYELEAFKHCGLLRNQAWNNAACSRTHNWICKRKSEKPPISL
ncbi:C-type lectin domain family 4 member E-like isoform X2 [Heterodontus francisci]|uniref:C-type lectin domain family 4 member E-like isoform X2 n=1 Tax=Heterodontus francisci TaxID=7792 RepID=UPI00355B4C31